MVLLKRNLEGFRVHSYVAACTANLKAPRTVSFSIWGSSAVLIRRRRCRNSTYANWYWQWNVIAMKEAGEYFGCMKQSFR
jgi:hypothetical protein